MAWLSFFFGKSSLKVKEDLSGGLTISVDGPELLAPGPLAPGPLASGPLALADPAAILSPLDSSVLPAGSVDSFQRRPYLPHVACVPIALAFCLPFRPFFRSSVAMASPAPVTAAVASLAPVASLVAAPVPAVSLAPVASLVPVTAAVASLELLAAPLQLRSTAPTDTARDSELLKAPVPSVAPLQVKTTQASSEESLKIQ